MEPELSLSVSFPYINLGIANHHLYSQVAVCTRKSPFVLASRRFYSQVAVFTRKSPFCTSSRCSTSPLTLYMLCNFQPTANPLNCPLRVAISPRSHLTPSKYTVPKSPRFYAPLSYHPCITMLLGCTVPGYHSFSVPTFLRHHPRFSPHLG